MSIFGARLLDVQDAIFDCFDEVYLFGSSLVKDDPVDIDVLLVYKSGQDLSEVSAARLNVVNALSKVFQGKLIDVTALSEEELAHSRFLEKVRHIQIKGIQRHEREG